MRQETFSCDIETNYTRRHKFVGHKNNCCQVPSRSVNDQAVHVRLLPLFVNESNEGLQLSPLKTTSFLDFACRANINIFSTNPNHTPVHAFRNIWAFKIVLPLFLLSFHCFVNKQISKFSLSVLQKNISFKLDYYGLFVTSQFSVQRVTRIKLTINKQAFFLAMWWTWEIWRALKKQSCSRPNSYASWVLSNLHAVHN